MVILEREPTINPCIVRCVQVSHRLECRTADRQLVTYFLYGFDFNPTNHEHHTRGQVIMHALHSSSNTMGANS